MWEDHGVIHFAAAISHPQSVGLSERYVQMVIGRIRLRCISLGSSKNWGLLVEDARSDINTHCVRIHWHTPSKILLGFNAYTSRRLVLDVETAGELIRRGNWRQADNIPDDSDGTIHVYMDRQDEKRTSASQKHARSQDQQKPTASLGHKRLKARDLVLVRDIQLAKEKGKKLEARWSTPRILERISKSGVCGHIRQLHDPPGKTKAYHIDDLVPYVARTPNLDSANTISPAVEYSRDALGDVQGRWVSGQTAFNLEDVRVF